MKCPPSVPQHRQVLYPPQPEGAQHGAPEPFHLSPQSLPTRCPKYLTTESWHRPVLWACLGHVCDVLVLCKDPQSPSFLLTPAAASGPPFPLITCTPSSHWLHQLLSSPLSKLPLSQASPLCSTSPSPLPLALTDSCLLQKMPCPQQPLQRFLLSPVVRNTCCIAGPVLGILRAVTHFTPQQPHFADKQAGY